MKSGDPKKALPLAIVAILVVGMAVFQILPSGEAKPLQGRAAPAASAAQDAQPAAQPEAMGIEMLRQQLTTDPFSHPHRPCWLCRAADG
jgi:hypothetical protein